MALRLRVRTMLALIALAALLLGAFEAGRRWERARSGRGTLVIRGVRHVGGRGLPAGTGAQTQAP